MKVDGRIFVTRQPNNIGSTLNYIDAFSHVTTEFFVPLADDDRLLPDFLYTAYTQLVACPEAGAAAFYASCVDDAGKVLYIQPQGGKGTATGFLTPAQGMRELMVRGHFLWSAVLWRKQVLDHIGYPYFHTGLPSDVDFQVQAFSKFPIILSHELGAVYTQHPGQHSNVYSRRDIPSFAKLAARMDRATRNLFPRDEYEALRSAFLSRFKPTWRISPREPIAADKALPVAALAIGRLGDREVAAELLNAHGHTADFGGRSLLQNLVQDVVETQAELERIKLAWLEQPLSFRKVAFVDRNPASGALQERASNMFKVGEPIVVYAEPVGQKRKRNSDGTYNSGFNVDLVVKTSKGQVLISQEDFTRPEFTSKSHNHQATVVLMLKLEAAPAGDYLLQYAFRDKASEKSGMVSIPFVLQ